MSRGATRLIKESIEYADVRVLTVHFLGNFVMQNLSAWQLKEAVRSGLIEAFVAGSHIIPHLSKRIHQDVIRILENNVLLGMAPHSLLSAVLHSIDNIDPDIARSRIPKSRLTHVWETFPEILLDRVVLRVLYTLGMITGSRWQCDEVCHIVPYYLNANLTKLQCSKQFMKNNLKRCGGCKYSLSCSKECQAAAWNANHKVQCKKRQRDPKKLEDGGK